MATIVQDILSEEDFHHVSDMVYRHCGINLHDGKKDLVRARLGKRVRTLGLSSVSQYLAHLRADESGDEFGNLIDAISTNLTSFFREQSHFDFLEGKILPALLRRKHKSGRRRIRAWSAGCSTGEEPYSLAMTLLEAVEGQGAWDVKLLATDISRPVLERARQGRFDEPRAESVPAPLREKYFARSPRDESPEYEVVPRVKQLIRFNYLNLMKPWPFAGPFDFIFCRNVMIYFDKPTQEKLVNRFWECLEVGGVFFTGHSETLNGVSHRFRYVQPTIYVK
jgi:chemotaxis protein methyltransferase CheR